MVIDFYKKRGTLQAGHLGLVLRHSPKPAHDQEVPEWPLSNSGSGPNGAQAAGHQSDVVC
jgi:hypothetical protein